ncbi:hypothetical protein ACQ143_11305 [Microbacterium sp. MC2]
MTSAASATPSAPVTAWAWGGGLLIGSALLQLSMMTGFEAMPGARQVGFWLGSAVFAAALVLFALGLRGRGSVVAGRMPGIVALLVLAAWPVLDAIGGLLVPASASTAAEFEAYAVWATVAAVVWLAAALGSVVAIGRAGVVPGRWRWAPAWGLAVVVGSLLSTQVVAVALGSDGMQVVLPLLQLQSMLTVLVPVLLGILAIVLGLTPRRVGAVRVYPPEA